MKHQHLTAGLILVFSSLLFGYWGWTFDGYIGDGSGSLLGMAGFFLPSVFVLGMIYDHMQQK